MTTSEKDRLRTAEWQRSHPEEMAAYRLKSRLKKPRPLCVECEEPIPYPAAGRKTCGWKCSRMRRLRQDRERRSAQYEEFDAYKVELGCAECGYNTFACALDFHHRDPADKERRVTHATWKTPTGVAELEKCVLLCANCHRVEHHVEGVPSPAKERTLQTGAPDARTSPEDQDSNDTGCGCGNADCPCQERDG